MAMRPRGGGRSNAPRGGARPRSGGSVWPVYEDFRPVSEWQQDEEFHTLNIFLPGFTKEQIRVSTEDKNIIRVRGERLVAGNKWSRFQEDFQVPENGDINSVRAKYQGGTLSITVSKKKKNDKPKSTDIEKKQPMTQNEKDKTSEAGTSLIRDEKTLEPQKISSDPRKKQGLGEEKKTPEDQAEARRAAERSKSTERTDTKKTSNEPIINHPLSDGKSEGRSIAPLRDVELEADTIASIGLKEKKILSEKADEVIKRRDDKNSSRSLPDAAAAAKKMKPDDKNRATGDKGTNGKQITPSHGADYEASKMQKLTKMKGLTELNEERQLLVNMGVAVLIIMGLSAYVTYKFVKGKEKY